MIRSAKVFQYKSFSCHKTWLRCALSGKGCMFKSPLMQTETRALCCLNEMWLQGFAAIFSPDSSADASLLYSSVICTLLLLPTATFWLTAAMQIEFSSVILKKKNKSCHFKGDSFFWFFENRESLFSVSIDWNHTLFFNTSWTYKINDGHR